MNDRNMQIKILDSVIYSKTPEEFLERANLFNEYMMMYNCAIKEIVTKVEILNDELKLKFGRSPIEFIQSRVKAPGSIIGKINKKNLEVNIESIKSLDDIAGVRIICSFLDDIYRIADMIAVQDDIRVIEQKDYIKHPKESGYRSFHMVVEIPVFFSEKKEPLKVEIQIRTIAMDFWASLEHQLKYKSDIQEEDPLSIRLKQCAKVIADTDFEMQDIRTEIDFRKKN